MTKKLKKPIAFLTVFAMLMSMLLYFPAGTFGGFDFGVRASAEVTLQKPTFGDGSSSDPYILKTKENLYWFANQANYSGICAKLGNDITVNSNVLDSNWNLNSGPFDEWTPIANYCGTFDGNNYSISGIYINNTGNDYQGFFDSIGYSDSASGYVKNLTITDSYISGDEKCGGICSYVSLGTISNCTFKGVVKGTEYVGGIAGRYAHAYVDADIQYCKSYGKVIGTESVGGIIGSIYGDPSKEYTQTIKRCENHAEVSGEHMVGGLFGTIKNYKVNFEDCHNYGDVTLIERSIDTFIGGICGLVGTSQYSYPIVTVNNCSNSGNITGRSYVGGIFGYAMIFWGNTNTFKNCSNSGSISGRDRVGGLFGCIRSAEVSDCHNIGAVSGEQFVGGICGLSYGDETKITRVFNTGNITGTVQYIGGLFGKTEGSVQYVTESYNTGEVDGTGAQGVGGIIGSTNAGSMPQLTKNCYNTGKITGLKYVGGISGVSGCTNTASVEYCFNTGEITATGGSAYGLVSSGGEAYVTVSNSYYDVDVNPDSKMTIYNFDKIAKRMPTSAFKSGEVAYLLQAGGGNWGQRVSRDVFSTLDNHPVLTTGSTGSKYRVYYVQYPENVDYYHNHKSGAVCAICPFNPIQPRVIDGVYQISDSSELLWFSQYVNGTLDTSGTHPDAKAVLTASFSVNSGLLDKVAAGKAANEYVWQPIGSTTAFTGSFDGQGHTISGLYCDNDTQEYIGLFAKIGSGGKVTNVGVNDSYFNGSDNVGGIAGQNAGEISNCFFFKGTVTAASGTNKGDICGSNSSSVTNCYYLADSETDSIDGTTAKTESSFTGGEVAYKLNDNPSEPVWGQLIDSDALPVQIDNANTVYYGRKNPVYHNHTADMTYCDDCPSYFGAATAPSQNSKGEYMITNIDELYWFANFVNSGNTGADAVLMNDIEVNDEVLDENGDLISDIIPYWTPIGTDSNPFIGSFDGQCYKISGLYVDNSEDNIGLFGVIGSGGGVSNVGVIDSYFSGNDYVGAIAGKNNGTISGCFSMCTVNAAGSNTGGVSGSGGTVYHSFYLSDSDSGEAKTAEKFKNGDVAYNLNSDRNNPVWGQEIESDPLPVSCNDENKVYFAQGEYHNHSGESCTLCTIVLPTEPTLLDGVYQITKPSELEWFAQWVNSGNTTAKAILENDIRVNMIAAETVNSGSFLEITSVGTQEKPFEGSFDGDGYTISGLCFDNANAGNVGLFGYVSGGSIARLCIADSIFSGDTNVGAVCGYNGGATISECYVNCDITATKYAGGICGYNSGTIKDCLHVGDVNSTNAGGIVGDNDGKVTNCVNLGAAEGANCDNICGDSNASDVQNCYYNAELTSCANRFGTKAFSIELTAEDFLPGAATEWVKAQNDYTNHILHYPILKNVTMDDIQAEYTPAIVIENKNTAPVKYGDDLSFSFDVTTEINSNTATVTELIDPTVLAALDFVIEYNGEVLYNDFTVSGGSIKGKAVLWLITNGKTIGYIDISALKPFVVITEDLEVGEHTFRVTYNGTSIPWLTGTSGFCTVTIVQAKPTVVAPTASEIDYGKKLKDSELSDTGWSWVDSDIIPTVANNGYKVITNEPVDYVHYDYSNVDGYDPVTHLITKTIPVTVNHATPIIVVKPKPSAALPGKTITVSAVISNPNNDAMTDLPAVSFSYKIGSGAEIAITGNSFVIPENTAIGTIIKVIATTPVTANYSAGTNSANVIVTDCKHVTKTLQHNENSHWYHCDNCGADLDIEEHKGGTATCTEKAVCTVCEQAYGSVDSNNHGKIANVWSSNATGHWHECEACHAQLDKAEHNSSGPATEDTAELCTICSYVITRASGRVATPEITPNGGSYKSSQTVTITCGTDNAVIYYTTNGDAPTANSKKYTGAFTITSTTTVKAIALKLGVDDSEIAEAAFTRTSSGGGRPSRPTTNNLIYLGSKMSWSEIADALAKLAKGSEAVIELNGNTTVPVEVIKVIDERELKVTFVVDSVKSWKTDGAEITTPAATDLSILVIRSLKTDSLRGVSGIQFTTNRKNIATDLTVVFKSDYAGKFANLYKNASGNFTFVTCAKLDKDGKVILPDVIDKGDYVAMLCEFSDLLGDMNNDGAMTAADASAILKQIVGIANGANPEMADLNGDGKVTAADASAILKRIVGLA